MDCSICNRIRQFITKRGTTRQSPIDIKDAIETRSLPPLQLSFEDGPTRDKLAATNTGQTLKVDCAGHILGKLTGGPVGEDQYVLEQFHFHWGDAANHGSEHTIDGKHYSGELHFVYRNQKYSSCDEAVKHDDGLAVAGVLLEETEGSKSILPELFEFVPMLQEPGSSSTLPATLSLQKAMPKNGAYYTYLGSLTTPEYDECITWIVFRDCMKISSANMGYLRKMKDEDGSVIMNNWRDVQDIKGRQIQLVTQ